MELRQIRSFLSIAETLHFGRTAEMIHLSQPALSLQIRALENEIGVRLFERNRRKTALTAAGIAFREEATGALLGLDQAVHKAKLAAKGKLGILRIGFISTAGNEIVPAIIRQFREMNAEVEFSLRNILTIDQIQMLEAGSLDIGFLRLPISECPGLEVVTVHREPFVLVVEGSIPNEALKSEGYWCGFGNNPATGQPMTTSEWLDRLAPKATAIVAVGTCATYGGLHAMSADRANAGFLYP